MTQIDIRACNLSDKETVEGILRASYGTLLQEHYSANDLKRVVPLISAAQADLLESGTYHLLMYNEKPAACGGWTNELPGDSNRIIAGTTHVRQVATHPDYLRKGLARKLMEHCFHAARTASATKMMCYSSLAAVDFYKSVGFKKSRR